MDDTAPPLSYWGEFLKQAGRGGSSWLEPPGSRLGYVCFSLINLALCPRVTLLDLFVCGYVWLSHSHSIAHTLAVTHALSAHFSQLHTHMPHCFLLFRVPYYLNVHYRIPSFLLQALSQPVTIDETSIFKYFLLRKAQHQWLVFFLEN